MRRLLVAVCLIAVASLSFAGSATNRLPEVVVTGALAPTPAADSGSAVTAITAEQIQQADALTVAELLRAVPSVTVVQQGRPGAQTSVFLRGANSKQTLVLIDGARCNNPVNGLATFASLTPDQIERIEIVRGPQSALYGADAIGGVINIITRRGTGPLTGAVTVEAGSYDSFRQTATASGAAGKFNYALAASHFFTDNPYPNDDYENSTAAGSIGFDPTSYLKLDASVRATWSDGGVAGVITNGAPVVPNSKERLTDAILFARGGAELTLADFWRQTLFIANTHETMFDRGNPFARSDTRSDLFEVGWTHNLALADWNTFSGGLDWYRNKGEYEVSGAAPFNEGVDNIAGFVEDRATLFQRLTLTGGARVDHHSTFGTEATFRGTGVLRFDETGTRLKASGGTGFKAPTLNDLYQSFPPFPPFFGAFLANPNLKPEHSTGWDAGFEQDLGPRATLSARYFENNIRGLITSAIVTPPTTPPDFTLKNVNHARTGGIEIALEVRPVRDLTLWANYTWLADVKDLTTGQRLLRRPELAGSVGGSYRMFDRVNVNTQVALTGAREDFEPLTGATVSNAGYVKWDIGASAEVLKNFQVFARVENVLDDRYDEARGYPALGRTVWGGGAVKF